MQPYEKFLTIGPEALTDDELLAIMIRTGVSGCDSTQTAAKILDSFPERQLSGLFHVNIHELKQIPGIGEVKAVRIKCIAELARRIAQTCAAKKLQFTKPDTVAAYYMESMRHLEKEQVLLLLFDQKMQLIAESHVSLGTVSSSMMSPREVFVEALRFRAVQIMLLHNHPSGDPTPSKQDIMITKRMVEAGNMLNIPVSDHIIIGDRKFFSFREKNIL